MRQSLVKTATFAAVHFTVAFTVAYLLTGSFSIASAIAIIGPLANTVAYFFHERAWARSGMPAAAGPAGDRGHGHACWPHAAARVAAEPTRQRMHRA